MTDQEHPIVTDSRVQSKTVWDIQRQIKELSETLAAETRAEFHMDAIAIAYQTARKDPASFDFVADKVCEFMTERMVSEISSNRSTWSGGFSPTNLCEQVRRSVATEYLSAMGRFGSGIGEAIRKGIAAAEVERAADAEQAGLDQ